MRKRLAYPFGWVLVSLFALSFAATSAYAQRPGPTRDVSGTVSDVDGQPVANATVAVTGGTATTTTGADGAFKLKVPQTNLTLDVTAEGFTARQVTLLA